MAIVILDFDMSDMILPSYFHRLSPQRPKCDLNVARGNISAVALKQLNFSNLHSSAASEFSQAPFSFNLLLAMTIDRT